MSLTPKDFFAQPCNSVIHKHEAEVVARNIMVILCRTGNTWRKLPWETYLEHRLKDGGYSDSEERWFKEVIGYTICAEGAGMFSLVWAEVVQ